MITENYIEFVGIIAGICTTFSFVPQIIQICKSRSARAISLPMYIVFSMGIFLWIMYGILIGALAVILANSLTLVFSISIIIMKIIWK